MYIRIYMDDIEILNRIRTLCDLNDIENELHVILKCPCYIKNWRWNTSKKYYFENENPSVFTLIKLLNC